MTNKFSQSEKKTAESFPSDKWNWAGGEEVTQRFMFWVAETCAACRTKLYHALGHKKAVNLSQDDFLAVFGGKKGPAIVLVRLKQIRTF